MSLNPPTQYATDANLRARQRLWEHQQPPFDLVSWVLELAGLSPGSKHRVLDVGCGNGLYLTQLRSWRIAATGCDLSQGMLASARATERNLVNADVTRLPFSASAFTEVACVRATAAARVVLTDASAAADYVTSVEDHYQPETTRPWSEVVDDVRGSVRRQIDANGSFVVEGQSGAFICS